MSDTPEPQTEGVLTPQTPPPAALDGSNSATITPQQDSIQNVTAVNLSETGADEKRGPAPAQASPPNLIHIEQTKYVRPPAAHLALKPDDPRSCGVEADPIHQEALKEMPMIAPEAGPLMVTPLKHLGDTPAYIECPSCHNRTLTSVEKVGSTMQSLSAALCCLACGLITVCIPYLCHWFEDTEIFCSSCRVKVAKIPHDGPIEVFWPKAPPQVASTVPQKAQ